MLLILRGVSNSFKSSFSKRFPHQQIVSLDELRIKMLDDVGCMDYADEISSVFNAILNSRLRLKADTVIDNTNLSLPLIDKLVDKAINSNNEFLILSFKREIGECIAGNRLRSLEDSKHFVPSDVIMRQFDSYQKHTPQIREKYSDSFYEFNVSNDDIDEIYKKYLKIRKEL